MGVYMKNRGSSVAPVTSWPYLDAGNCDGDFMASLVDFPVFQHMFIDIK